MSATIKFSHLIELACTHVHMNYVEQFLSNSNTRLPSLVRLHIQYEHLLAVTENFTRNATRINCDRLKSIRFYGELTMVHSTDFYLYFPSLWIVCSLAWCTSVLFDISIQKNFRMILISEENQCGFNPFEKRKIKRLQLFVWFFVLWWVFYLVLNWIIGYILSEDHRCWEVLKDNDK